MTSADGRVWTLGDIQAVIESEDPYDAAKIWFAQLVAAEQRGRDERQAEIDALRSAIAEHDKVRADLLAEEQRRHLADWEQATSQIQSLEAERVAAEQRGAEKQRGAYERGRRAALTDLAEEFETSPWIADAGTRQSYAVIIEARAGQVGNGNG